MALVVLCVFCSTNCAIMKTSRGRRVGNGKTIYIPCISIGNVRSRLHVRLNSVLSSATQWSTQRYHYIGVYGTLQPSGERQVRASPAHKCVYNIHPGYTERVAKGRAEERRLRESLVIERRPKGVSMLCCSVPKFHVTVSPFFRRYTANYVRMPQDSIAIVCTVLDEPPAASEIGVLFPFLTPRALRQTRDLVFVLYSDT